jgi:LPS-assembly protein
MPLPLKPHPGSVLKKCSLILALLPAAAAQAQTAPAPAPLVLQMSPRLQEQIAPVARSSMPTFLFGERLSGRTDLDSVLEGNAELRRGDTVIRADRLEYYPPDDLARARGNVRINRGGNIYEGPLLELKVDAAEGFFIAPRYQFLQNQAHGQADRVDFLDENRAVITNATYTTCRRLPGPDWLPDWILRAASITIDNEEDEGVAQGALLSFMGVPVLPVPYMSFPLSGKRKSGILPPTVGVDSVNGLELVLPYYWNIAPNRDAKVVPTLMTKRGLDVGTEFRFLERNYSGTASVNYMPSDLLRNADRWSYAGSYQGQINPGVAAIGSLGLNLSLSRVSDDNYWRDFVRENTSLTQRLLANDANLSWGRGNFSANLRALKWQTLQDASSPIVPPYDRLPQVTGRYARTDLGGFDFSLDADHTQFQADSSLTLQPNARRSFALAQLSRTWSAPQGQITPKLQLHASTYEFDAPLANGDRSYSRVLPTFSVDAGLVFERDANFFGRPLLQTLEPRLFYVNTPFRDQNLLPNYDSGANDFNFATIYTENAFVGNDRIADNNLLTLGLTSRLLDPQTGAEALRLGIAQRFRFNDQKITLPGGVPEVAGISDILLGATANWNPRWTLDTTVQFNPRNKESTRSTIGARYSPGDYRVVSAAYRFQRGASEQLDLGWQWPLNDLWGDKGQNLGPGQGQGSGRWYSVGRLNYSLMDRKLVDAVVGFEYDAGCWLGRVVLEQLQTGVANANQRIMFQLEFVGFTRIGANPLKTLKDNIPRYQYLREQISAPSRFSQYD